MANSINNLFHDAPQFNNIEEAAEFVTVHMTNKYVIDEKDINYGYCFIWAYLVSRFVKGAKFIMARGHVAIKYKGKYYDADHPEGVEELSSLDWMREAKLTGLTRMCWYWSRFGVQREEFRNIIKLTASKKFFNKIQANKAAGWDNPYDENVAKHFENLNKIEIPA